MNNDAQLKLMAYMDGELSEAEALEVKSLLSTDPESVALLEELTWTRVAVTGNEPEVKLPETRDFYWSQISRQIEAAEKQADRVAVGAPQSGKWWHKLLVPATGLAAVTCAFFLATQKPATTDSPTISSAPEPVAESASVYSYYDENARISVIWVTTDGDLEFQDPTRNRDYENDQL